MANVGDNVKEDDEVIIMEAMKMEIPVTAPADGTIRRLNVKEGDPVEANTILAEME
jgi:acetyl-CoA carboxylase biotin carboxyl carrier protein